MQALDRIAARRLVGRSDEMALLRRAAAEAAGGAGRCVLITGPPGLGKSRLVGEVRAGFAGQTIECRCYEDESAFPLAPLQAGLRELHRVSSAAEKGLFELRAAALSHLLPELRQAEAGARVQSGPPTNEPSEPAARQRALFEGIAGLAFDLAERQPLLVAFEDLHWADETTLLFLRYFVRRIAGHAVLVFATSRTDEVSASLAGLRSMLERERLAEEIALQPLMRAEVDALLHGWLGTQHPGKSPLTGDFVDAMTRSSGGNPLYVEELLAAMIRAGDLYPVEGGWARRGGPEMKAPASVQEAVRRQSQGLTAEAQLVLALAAVAGRECDFELLRRLTGLPEAELLARLKELVAAGLVAEGRKDIFAFRHPVVREAVVGQLLSRERRALHRQVADEIERGHAADLETHAAELAYHYYEAGAWQETLFYARRAGEQAQRLDATREALTQYNRAVYAAQQLAIEPQTELLLARAELYERTGDFELADADLNAALDAAERAGRPREAWEALLKLGYLWAERDYGKSLAWLERAAAAPEAEVNPIARAQTLNRIGNAYLNRDRPAEALPYHRTALQAFEEAGDRAGQAATLELMGVCYYNLPDVLEGAACEERALVLAESVGKRSVIFHASIHLLLPLRLETEVGPPVESERLIQLGENALRLARGTDWPGGEGQALGLLGGFYGLLGQYDRALGCLNEGRRLAERHGYAAGIAAAERMIAAVLMELFAFDDAADGLRRAFDMANEAGAGLFADIAALALAQTLVSRCGPGDLAEARGLLERLLGGQGRAGGRTEREALVLQAELELAEGNPSHALETLAGVLAGTRHLAEHGPAAVPRLALLHGQILAGLGRADEAEAALACAIRGAASQGRKPLLWRGHAALGRLMLHMRQRRAAREQFEQARVLIGELAGAVPDGQRRVFLASALATMPIPPEPSERRQKIRTHHGLTEREWSVARLVSEGRSNREIAGALTISERTAERHVANILAKLGLASRVQLAAWVTENLADN